MINFVDKIFYILHNKFPVVLGIMKGADVIEKFYEVSKVDLSFWMPLGVREGFKLNKILVEKSS